jgi:hypothetical protein
LTAVVLPALLGAGLVAAPAPEDKGSSALLKSILADLTLPPIGSGDTGEHNKPWPSFGPAALARYADKGPPDPKLRAALHKAQVAVWAVSFTPLPRELDAEVRRLRARMGFDETGLKNYLKAPIPGPPENAFRDMLARQSKGIARAQSMLEEIQEELTGLAEVRDKASPRWQATYDIMVARLNLQQVALDEYQFAYGQMRREFPDRKEGDSGWALVTVAKLHGDFGSKKMAVQASKELGKVIRDHPGTLWAEAARRMKEVPLGLEWRSAP